MPDDNAVQAAVVLQLLGLDSLAAAGVVQLGGDGVRASSALKRLDELGLIAV
jgi:hypothetical protein